MNFISGAFLVLFVLAFIAIVVATMLSTRPRSSRRLRGDEAIQDAINRYDRRQRHNWYRRFWD
jgi:cbb3-type cytochrome oxidase subunit 3